MLHIQPNNEEASGLALPAWHELKHQVLLLCLQDGRVPLHVAAMSGNLKAVQKLVAAGARQGSPDKVIAQYLEHKCLCVSR